MSKGKKRGPKHSQGQHVIEAQGGSRIESRMLGSQMVTTVTEEVPPDETAEKQVKDYTDEEIIDAVHEVGYLMRLTGPNGLQIWGIRLYQKFTVTSEMPSAPIEGNEIARAKPEGREPSGGGGRQRERLRMEWLGTMAAFPKEYAAVESSVLAERGEAVGEHAQGSTREALLSLARTLLKWQAVKDADSYSPRRDLVRGTIEWKRAIAQDDRSSTVVGRIRGVSPGFVRKTRQRYLAGEYGKVAEAPTKAPSRGRKGPPLPE